MGKNKNEISSKPVHFLNKPIMPPIVAWMAVTIGVVVFFEIYAFAQIDVKADISSYQTSNVTNKRKINQAAKKSAPEIFEAAKEPQASEDKILVKFKDTTKPEKRQEIVKLHKLEEADEVKQIGVKVFKVSPNDTPEEVIDRMKKGNWEDIVFAEVNMFFPLAYTPNDPQVGSQWHHSVMNDPAAWDSVNGSNVTVALGDTGVDPDHPDLMGHLVPGWNTYDNNSDTSDICGHGTATAGVEAAIGDNVNQLAGIAYGAKIMPLRVVIPSGTYKCYGDYSAMIKAITYAADQGAKTMNLSFDIYSSCSDSILASAADYLYKKGGILVIASGNSGTLRNCSNNSEIVVAGATGSADTIASFSSYGSYVDVASPGASVITTANGGGTSSASGTSFAAPSTGGVLALIYSANPSLSSSQAQQILFSTAVDLGTAGKDDYYGWGRPDAGAAVALAQNTIGGQDTMPPSAPSGLTAQAPDSTRVNLAWSASTDDVGVAGYYIYRDTVLLIKTTGASASYNDTTVIGGTTYSYTIAAYDAAGNISQESAPVNITVPVSTEIVAIINYSVTQKTSSTATIDFTANIPTAGSIVYGMKQKGSVVLNLSASDSASGTSHRIVLTGLRPNTMYQYQVTASNVSGFGSATSTTSSFRTTK